MPSSRRGDGSLASILVGSLLGCGSAPTVDPDAAAPSGASSQDASTSAADVGASADTRGWLSAMNHARATVGEAPLVWDAKAAGVAAAYAAMCTFAHNPNASAAYAAAGGGAGGLGENIAAGTTPEPPSDAVAGWLSEASSYDHATNSCAPGQTCGHYRQIIWSTTTAVGCAHVSCTTNSPFSGFTAWDFNVCDFSPPGNVSGMAPY